MRCEGVWRRPVWSLWLGLKESPQPWAEKKGQAVWQPSEGLLIRDRCSSPSNCSHRLYSMNTAEGSINAEEADPAIIPPPPTESHPSSGLLSHGLAVNQYHLYILKSVPGMSSYRASHLSEALWHLLRCFFSTSSHQPSHLGLWIWSHCSPSREAQLPYPLPSSDSVLSTSLANGAVKGRKGHQVSQLEQLNNEPWQTQHDWQL